MFRRSRSTLERAPVSLAWLYSANFFDSIRTGLLLQSGEGAVEDLNRAAASLLGIDADRPSDPGLLTPWLGAVREDGQPYTEDDLPTARTLRTGETLLDVVVGVGVSGQVRRWLSVDTYPIELEDGSRGVVAAFDDIDAQFHERHLLKLLADVNRVVMATSDEATSLQRLCSTLVERGPYALVWIGVASEGSDGVIEATYADGVTAYLYEGMTSVAVDNPTGHGPSGVALRTGTVQIANDLRTHPAYEPWRERAASFGFGSSVAIPFAIAEQRAGLFVYADVPNAFDAATVRGLEQIAREVGFGVAYLRSVRQSESALEATITAIESRRAAEHALTESEQRFRLAFEHNMAPMSFSDLNDRMIAVNDAFCEMVGYSREELLGGDTIIYTHPDDVGITEETLRRMIAGEVDHTKYVKRYVRKDGRIIMTEVSRSAARDRDGHILYFVFSERDVTEERKLTDQLSHQAFHDPLTGLANRALFDDRLSQAQARIQRQRGFGAVLLLDLDDFKGVNDTQGHLVGDQLLLGIARRFEAVTRATDTLCRFGGDEFLYLAEDLRSPGEAEDVAKRLLEALEEPFSFADIHIEQHASIGIVILNQHVTSDDVVQSADVALYEAKRQHRGGYAVFTPSMQQRAISRFTLIQELRHALQDGELSMHYQPIVDLATSEVVGLEALMRWEHPERGQIPPGSFIALAEQSDLILELGAFALREAVTAAASWGPSREGGNPPFVSVNLSAHQFYDPNLLRMIERALGASGLEPERLVLEITEGVALLDTAETLSVMQALTRLGISIALDDFGTGYSSLSYLAMLHPKIIKVDQSFVRPLVDNEQNDLLLETIVSLGSKLHMTMLAEGIETAEQLARLRAPGCELGQGFLFSPAVPADEVPRLLARGGRASVPELPEDQPDR